MARSASKDWQAGYPIWMAVSKFAPPKVWNEFYPLYERYCLPTTGEAVQTASINQISPRMDDPLKDFARFQELEAQLKNWIIDELRGGQFQAIAYSQPRLRGSKPEALDLNNWVNGTYSWETEILKAGDRHYSEIHILKMAGITAHKTGKRGRPSYEPLILAAWPEFKERSDFKKFATLKAALPAFRKLLEAKNPDIEFKDKEPSDSTLYAVLAALWQGASCQPKKDSKKST